MTDEGNAGNCYCTACAFAVKGNWTWRDGHFWADSVEETPSGAVMGTPLLVPVGCAQKQHVPVIGYWVWITIIKLLPERRRRVKICKCYTPLECALCSGTYMVGGGISPVRGTCPRNDEKSLPERAFNESRPSTILKRLWWWFAYVDVDMETHLQIKKYI